MEGLDLSKTRHIIVNEYARWCAFSSTRSGSPLKARKDVYPLIDTPDYETILTGSNPINQQDFNLWHKENVFKIQNSRSEMCIGWAAKLINVYLKTMVYVASIGRPGLENLIHPPIDGGLWEGINKAYGNNKDIISKTHSVKTIKDIEKYEQYEVIMNGMKLIANEEKCRLIEVEKYWEGTEFKSKKA